MKNCESPEGESWHEEEGGKMKYSVSPFSCSGRRGLASPACSSGPAKVSRNPSGLDRRQFLGTSAACLAAAGWTWTARADEAQPQLAKIIVGAHPWVYAATQPQYDIYPILDRIFADMRYAGLDGIELMHTALYPEDAVARIKTLSAEHQLPVIGTSYGAALWDRQQTNAVLENAAMVIDRLAQVGGRTLGISVGDPGRKKTPDEFDCQADVLRNIQGLCRRQGVVPNLHNHTYEVRDEQHDLRGTLARIPDFPLGPDLNWLVRGGVDPVEFIRQHKRQIVFLHLRDQTAAGRWSEALGEGDMDYAAIAAALREVGFTGDAVIELAHERDFQPTRPLRESLKISREFVRRVLGC
jgi:sugar phosphate isomerase/epimerase